MILNFWVKIFLQHFDGSQTVLSKNHNIVDPEGREDPDPENEYVV